MVRRQQGNFAGPSGCQGRRELSGPLTGSRMRMGLAERLTMPRQLGNGMVRSLVSM